MTALSNCFDSTWESGTNHESISRSRYDTEKINYLENKLAKGPVKDNTKHVTPEVSKEDEKQTSKLEVDQKSDPESETMDLQVEEATDKKADELVAAPEPEVLRLMFQLIEAVEFIGSLESKIRALEEELKTDKGLVDNYVVDKPLVEKTQVLG